MTDNGSTDTLERPVVAAREKVEEGQLTADLAGLHCEQETLRAGEPAQATGLAERLRSLLRHARANGRRHIKRARVVLKNRKARSTVGVPELPPFLKMPNVAALLIALCGLAMVFADHNSPLWARELPSAYHSVFSLITDVGKSDWILIPTGLWVLAVILGRWQQLRFHQKMVVSYLTLYGSYLFFVVAGSGLLAIALKWNIGRARPALFDELGPLYFDLFAWQSKLSSLPSGHSTTSGALIVGLALIAPRYRWLFAAVGGWVAFSRIIIGAHYPSDVIAGLVVGGVFAYFSARWMARRRLGFRFSREGGIEPAFRGMFMKARLLVDLDAGNTRVNNFKAKL